MDWRSSFARNIFAKHRLLWALAISVVLHALVLSRINWNSAHQSTAPHRLTVSLDFLPSTRPEKIDLPRPHPSNIPPKKNAPAPENIALPKPDNIIGDVDRLNMSQLLNQAREYAGKELRTSKPTLSMYGDYYGTYSGSDNGTFYVHFDADGHASGSGESGIYHVSFNISGDANEDGLIQMSGTGIAGIARFKGRLDTKTRKASGSWTAPGIGSGTFSGQHE